MMHLNSGKTKSIYTDEDPNTVLIKFNDTITANNGKKTAEIYRKGLINCQISQNLFILLEKAGVDTHYLSRRASTYLLVKKAEVIPIEVVVRNKAAGGICRQTTIEKGTDLSPALVEFYLKDDSKNDPLLTTDRIIKMGYDINLIDELTTKAHQVNFILKDVFKRADYQLVDFKLEFGYSVEDNKLILVDEISPDSCRLWEEGTNKSHDKDLFRQDTDDLDDQVQDVWLGYQLVFDALAFQNALQRKS